MYNYKVNGIQERDEPKKIIKRKIQSEYSSEIVKYNMKDFYNENKPWNERIKIILYIDSIIDKLSKANWLKEVFSKIFSSSSKWNLS